MVFNVIYNSNKGIKIMIFCFIILALIYGAEFIATSATNTADQDKLNKFYGGELSRNYQGIWEQRVGLIDMECFFVETKDGVKTGIEHGPYTQYEMTQIQKNMVNNPEKVPFLQGEVKVDAIGSLQMFWNMVTFNIIPFPFNIIPTFVSVIMWIIIAWFFASLVSGFMPNWL